MKMFQPGGTEIHGAISPTLGWFTMPLVVTEEWPFDKNRAALAYLVAFGGPWTGSGDE